MSSNNLTSPVRSSEGSERSKKEVADEGALDEQQRLITDEAVDGELHHQLELLTASNKQWWRWTIALCVALALSCIVLATSFTIVYRQNPNDVTIKSPVPPIPLAERTFERDERFAGPMSTENDMAWGSLTPDGGGFIFVNDTGKYDLPPGKQTSKGDIYDISLFHQLHCLAGIRNHVYLLWGSIGRNNSAAVQDILLSPQVDHIGHCFDYIRQALMCAGDMTVEWPREEPDGRRFAFDGWGVTHQCKDWNAIMKFMKDNNAQIFLDA